jgi:PilZ domain-containing protein
MDPTATPDLSSTDFSPVVNAVLAQVDLSWADTEVGAPGGQVAAAVLHVGRGMMVLEAADPKTALPPLGTEMTIHGDQGTFKGRLAEHGRGGRFLVSIGERPVRRALRLKVSLPGSVRSPELEGTRTVEIVDLTTGGARLRGVELRVGSQLTLGFTPPYRDEPVSVRAVVAHGTHRATQPWVGVVFRLVALRGGR